MKTSKTMLGLIDCAIFTVFTRRTNAACNGSVLSFPNESQDLDAACSADTPDMARLARQGQTPTPHTHCRGGHRVHRLIRCTVTVKGLAGMNLKTTSGLMDWPP